MSKFFIRGFTSILLLLILYISMSYQLVLFLLLITISFFVLAEMFDLTKNMFNQKKHNIFLFNLFTLSYLIFFLSQLYLFVSFDYTNKLFFIYFLSICIGTDIGGYIFGNFFKGKKLTKISPNKTYSGLIGSYVSKNLY